MKKENAAGKKKSRWRRNRSLPTCSLNIIAAANGAEPRAFTQGYLCQRIISLKVMAEGRRLGANLLPFVFNVLPVLSV